MPVWLEVLLTLTREVLRALLTPLRLLGYLPMRKHWRNQAKLVLDGVAANDQHAAAATASLREFFARAKPLRGTVPHLFLSAGESSGERHAAHLLQQLPGMRVSAFGGPMLARAGASVLFSLSEHAVMGIVGVLKQLPLICSAFARYLRLLRDDPPDLVVLVDYPGLHLVMAKAAKRRGIPVLHYVAPQYWAWGPWRMRRYRRSVDATLTILPFETAFFARFRIPACYIGHPVLDDLAAQGASRTAPVCADARKLLVLLPGSRRAEIRANLPGMVAVARALAATHGDLRVVLPHKDPRRTALLHETLAALGADFVEHHEGALGPWLAQAWLTLAKSGTGSLEAALYGQPTMVVYQLPGPIAALGYRTLLSVPWVAPANLIAGREVVPEFCFANAAGWQQVAETALDLWSNAARRAQMTADLRLVRERLGPAGASARVAAIVQQFFAAPGGKPCMQP